MKNHDIKKRVQKDRPMVSVTLRIPEDVIDDLKRVAPKLGFSGYQPLMRAYIGQGLRQDLIKFENDPNLEKFVDILRRHGVNEDIINEAMNEVA